MKNSTIGKFIVRASRQRIVLSIMFPAGKITSMKPPGLNRRIYLRLRNFSISSQLRRVITIRSAQPPLSELTAKLLSKHRDGNIVRIEKLRKTLELDRFGVQIADELELTKCLYPTKQTRLRLPNGSTSSNVQLGILGKRLLYLQVNQAYLALFKRSASDVCGYDFNYPSKLDHMSNAKRRPATVILRHLKQISLVHLARFSIPDNRIPLRVQYSYDQKSFNAIIGYVSLTNDENEVVRFLKKMIAEKLINTVLLR